MDVIYVEDSMSEILDMVIEELRCSMCDGYLSCAPVMLQPDGSSICGRCQIYTGTMSTRDNAYETLSRTVLFPCRYKETGCPEKFKWNSAQEHESKCEYKLWPCPAFPTGYCPWTGTLYDLVDHYKQSHGKYVLKYPFALKADVWKDNEHNLLTELDGSVFLVQMKYGKDSGKLWIDVTRIIAVDSQINYSIIINIVSDKDMAEVTKCVERFESFAINEDKAVPLDVNIVEDVLGLTQNLLFKIDINQNKHFDDFIFLPNVNVIDNATPSTSSEFDFNSHQQIREGRIQPIIKCPNINCPEENTEWNISKHKFWFCAFQTQNCRICSKTVQGSMLNHYQLKHNHKLRYSEYTIGQRYSSMVLVDGVSFFCTWEASFSSLTFRVVSDLERDQIEDYRVEIHIQDPVVKRDAKLIVLSACDTFEYDWCEEIDLKDFPFVSTKIMRNFYVFRYEILKNI